MGCPFPFASTILAQNNSPPSLAWRIAGVVTIAVFGLIVHRILYSGLRRIKTRLHAGPSISLLADRVLLWTIVILALMGMLETFGILQNAWAAFTGMMALTAIGFIAVWSVLSNGFCWLILMLTQPFRIGDRIRIPSENVEGTVTDFTLSFTTLEQDGNRIFVPNNIFFQKIIIRVGPPAAQCPAE